jgi:hypothetical protein
MKQAKERERETVRREIRPVEWFANNRRYPPPTRRSGRYGSIGVSACVSKFKAKVMKGERKNL